MLSPFLSLLPTSPLLPQPLFRGAATPTPPPWKNPRCWSRASVPCIRDWELGEEGAGREGRGTGPNAVRAAGRGPAPLHPHPHLHPGGPRDKGGWGACLEDRTSSWQDTGQRPEVPSLSRTQGEKVAGAWGSPLPRSTRASDSPSPLFQTGTSRTAEPAPMRHPSP